MTARDTEFRFFSKIDDCASIWSSIGDNNTYWTVDYLSFLEKYPPVDFHSIYVLIYSSERLIGKALFQNLHVRLSKSYGSHDHSMTFKERMQEFGKKLVVPFLNFQLVVHGNVLLTGNYGHYFIDDIPIPQRVDITTKLNKDYEHYYRKHYKRPSGVLVKDLRDEKNQYLSKLSNLGYSRFKVQPKMKFKTHSSWNSFEDYKTSLKSKYRVRLKRAKKKLEPITRRTLNPEEISAHSEKMYNLYMETVGRAGFNLFFLHKEYFSQLALRLPKQVKLVGLFLDEEMVGFYSLVRGGTEFDAHFLGYSVKKNPKHQIYLNMLYFMIEDCIAENRTMLHMSRTALEIKSSVGAKPEELDLYVKHYNGLMNACVKSLLKLTVPKVEWLERNPFK